MVKFLSTEVGYENDFSAPQHLRTGSQSEQRIVIFRDSFKRTLVRYLNSAAAISDVPVRGADFDIEGVGWGLIEG